MLKLRVLSAVIGLPLLILALVFLPDTIIALLFTVCSLVSVYEVCSMLFPKLVRTFSSASEGALLTLSEIKGFRIHMIVSMGLALAVLLYVMLSGRGFEASSAVIGGTLACVLLGTFLSHDVNICAAGIFSSLVGVVYGVLPWVAIWHLYLLGSNAKYLFLLLALVWSGDTGAYFGGRFLGKHKLSPVKSPKKTWEGAVAGLLSSVLAISLFKLIAGLEGMGWLAAVLVGVCCGIIGQIGDLVESTLKRFSGVKDSGGLIPGHGGLLDRVDGLLFAAPLLWLILYSNLR